MSKKVLFCIIACINFCSCKVQQKLKDYYSPISPIEVIYVNSKQDSIFIVDDIKVSSIVDKIIKAKRVPAKFISTEEIKIKERNGKTVVINRNNEFLKANGVTYILKKSDCKKLNILLLKN